MKAFSAPALLILLAILCFLAALFSAFWMPCLIELLPARIGLARAKGVLQIAAVILAVNTILFQFFKEQRYIFPIAISISCMSALISYRFLVGAGLSGILFNPQDNLTYISWAQQARFGSFSFLNLYTIEEHRPLYFNPYFLLIGNVARIFDLSVISIMTSAGAAASGFLVLAGYFCSRLMAFPESAARWSTVLIAFSSGFSVPAFLAAKILGAGAPPGADLWYLDAILFSTFYAYPYHAFAFAIMGAVVILILLSQERKDGGILVLLGFLSFAMTLTRPYEAGLILFTYFLYVAVAFRWSRAAILAVVAAGAVPVFLYNAWLSEQPVWNYVSDSLLSIKTRPRFWIVGYGLVLPLALLGSFYTFRIKELENGRWFSLTAIALVAGLMILNVRQTKIWTGGHFFLCVLAGLGCWSISQRIRQISTRSLRKIVAAAAIMVASLFFVTSLYLLLAHFRHHKIDPELQRAASIARTNSAHRTPWVLCSDKEGSVLPGIAALRVFSGHLALTPGYKDEKQTKLIQAGIQPGGVSSNALFFRQLAGSGLFEFVLLHKNSAAFTYAKEDLKYPVIECYTSTCLFAIP